MSIRKLALAAAVVAGTLGFAGKADAQVIYTSGYSTTPVVYSSYYTPTYYTHTPASTYSSYYAPAYSNWYWSGYSDPYSSGYYTRSYYPYAYYSGPRLYVGPRGVYFGRRGWW